MQNTSDTPRRADYLRNRAALLNAAREVFAEHGADVSVDEIARRAGFAKGTFFRHFPTKESLIQALVVEHLNALGEIAREINTTREPGWGSLGLMMERFFEQIASDRSLADFVERGGRAAPNEALVHAREVLSVEVNRAVTGAKERGEIRPDVVGVDFPMIMFMIARSTAPHRTTQPALGRRYLRLFLDGIRAGHTSDLGDPPNHRN
jgi:AcrR family transcriptional regulator